MGDQVKGARHMPKQVAIYTRVSTDHQTTENQERELRAIADRMGWTVLKVYRDQGASLLPRSRNA